MAVNHVKPFILAVMQFANEVVLGVKGSERLRSNHPILRTEQQRLVLLPSHFILPSHKPGSER